VIQTVLEETCIIMDNFLTERGIRTKQTKNHTIYENNNFLISTTFSGEEV